MKKNVESIIFSFQIHFLVFLQMLEKNALNKLSCIFTAKKKKTKGSTKAESEPPLSNLSFNFDKMNLNTVTKALQESAKLLPTDSSEYQTSWLMTKSRQPKLFTTLSPSGKGQHDAKKNTVKVDRNTLDAHVAVTKEVDPCDRPDTGSLKMNKVQNVGLKNEMFENAKFVPLGERVKLRMQSRQKENSKDSYVSLHPSTQMGVETPKMSSGRVIGSIPKSNTCQLNTSQLSDMNSLIEEIEHLSVQETKEMQFQTATSTQSKPVVNTKYPMTLPSQLLQFSHVHLHPELQFSPSGCPQKFSSPSSNAHCSPSTFFRQSSKDEEIGGIPYSSPVYSTRHNFLRQSASEITTPADSIEKPESSAEKLFSRVKSGIDDVGKTKEFNNELFSFFGDKKEVPSTAKRTCDSKSVQQIVPGVGVVQTPDMKLSAQTMPWLSQKDSGRRNLEDVDMDASNISQFGNFNIQTSLLNSMCASLLQALTPKGASLSAKEYDSLLAQLNELDSQSDDDNMVNNVKKSQQSTKDEIVNANVDLTDVERASSGLKNLNVTLEPIRLLGESEISSSDSTTLSKSARKKLRRKERKKALEDIAHLNNMAKSKSGQNAGKEEVASEKTVDAINIASNKNTVKNMKVEQDKAKSGRNVNVGKKKVKEASEVTAVKQHKERGKGSNETSSDASKLSENVSFIHEKSDGGIKHTGGRQKQKVKGSVTDKKGEENDIKQSKQTTLKRSDTPVTNRCKADSREATPDATDSSEIDVSKKKRKKKKKVKKASSVIDMSLEGSMSFDKELLYAQYLRNALYGPRVKTGAKIEKASPLIDVSADDTILELESLSSKLTHEDLDSQTVSKLALFKQKKKLLLEKQRNTCKGEHEVDKATVNAGMALNNAALYSGQILENVISVFEHSPTEVMSDDVRNATLPHFEDILEMEDADSMEEEELEDKYDGKEISLTKFQTFSDTTKKQKIESMEDNYISFGKPEFSDKVTPFPVFLGIDKQNSIKQARECVETGVIPNFIKAVDNPISQENGNTQISNKKQDYFSATEVAPDHNCEQEAEDIPENLTGLSYSCKMNGLGGSRFIANGNECTKSVIKQECERNESVACKDSVALVHPDKVFSEEGINVGNGSEEQRCFNGNGDSSNTSGLCSLNGLSTGNKVSNDCDRKKDVTGASRNDDLCEVNTTSGEHEALSETKPDGKDDVAINGPMTVNGINAAACSFRSDVAEEVAGMRSVDSQEETGGIGVEKFTADTGNLISGKISVDSGSRSYTAGFVNYHASDGEVINYGADGSDTELEVVVSGANVATSNGIHNAATQGESFLNVARMDKENSGISLAEKLSVESETGLAQSPACLADRLKLKLSKKSTRNVLETFTNGKLDW